AKSAIAAALKQNMRGHYIDSIGGILLVKLFARAREEDRLLSEVLQAAGGADHNEGRQFVVFWRGIHGMNALLQITVLLLAVWLYQQSAISVGDVATALGITAMVAANIWWLLHVSTFFFSRFATIQEALDTIMQKHEVVDAPNAAVMQATKGAITFDNVTFAYGSNKVIFDNLSLEIPAGQKVGLVGYSGSGKTTFVRLILRLFDIQRGQIKVDGQDVAAVTQDSLHNAISFIPQDPELFHRTISENIAVAKPGVTQADIEEAARRARAHDFIIALPNGYDSVVGERGVKLSGGQRQRIAIARVALRDAPVLVLDEATSALDSVTEIEVQDSLTDLMRDRTTIVIAHRLSTLKHMDRILVFDEGRIVEDGRADDLLAKGGIFKTLWDTQVGGFLPDKHSHHV
ncbi:MAG: ABC transporter ATP-binding protein, partial [Bdellovibrionales bacterium]